MATGWSDGGSSSTGVSSSLMCQVDKQGQPSQSSNLQFFEKCQLCLSHKHTSNCSVWPLCQYFKDLLMFLSKKTELIQFVTH